MEERASPSRVPRLGSERPDMEVPQTGACAVRAPRRGTLSSPVGTRTFSQAGSARFAARHGTSGGQCGTIERRA
jgi:hypothetical protein